MVRRNLCLRTAISGNYKNSLFHCSNYEVYFLNENNTHRFCWGRHRRYRTQKKDTKQNNSHEDSRIEFYYIL